MSQQELLSRVVRALNDAGIDYMLTGSFASSLQGEPRATHDIDFVVSLPLAAVGALVEAFPPPDFYLDEQAARVAVAERGMFNLLSVAEGDKVDFWMLTDNPFDQSRFARKYGEEVLGMRLKVSSPEDTILAKLRWSRESGGSERQFLDALRVYEVQGRTLDLNYLERWATDLSVEDLWGRLKGEAELL